jgi:hypothetical protein
MTSHDKIELKLLDLAMADNNEGLCMACGEVQAWESSLMLRKYECECCNEKEVYGAQEGLLIFG